MRFVLKILFLIQLVSLFSSLSILSYESNLKSNFEKSRKVDQDFLQGERSFVNKESNEAQVITDDFLVNDDTLGGNEQYGANIARAKSGNFVIIWTDRRYGNTEVYAQRYNSLGIPQGSNFKVSDDTGIAGQSGRGIAMDRSGGFVIAWADGRNGNDIYAQRYDSLGIPIGSNFKINDGSANIRRAEPAVAMNDSGNFVIAWTCTPSSNDIYAQSFDHAGTRLGYNFKVNDDSGPAGQSEPDVSMDGSGNFIITWRDTRNPSENYDIYAQRYDSAGIALGANFMINDNSRNIMTDGPRIDMNDSGYCVITWYECCSRTWAQRYDPYGNPLGVNFLVPSDLEFKDQSDPDVAIDVSSDFVITWRSIQPSPSQDNIHAQRYSFTGTPIDSNLNVKDDTVFMFPRDPAIATDSAGNFVIAWDDDRNVNSDIYVQMYNTLGEKLGLNFKANDDIGSADQWYPSVASDNSGNFILAWIDLRNGSSYREIAWEYPDVNIQRYDLFGTPLGSNVKVNDDSGYVEFSPPAITEGSSGKAVITWQDSRNGWHNIYAQRYDSAGTPIGSNFKVSGGGYSFSLQFPAVAMDSCGSFVITWQIYGFWPYDYHFINAQKYDSSGNALGSIFRVDTEIGCARSSPPAIVMDKFGNFVIAWESGSSDIYAQRYDSSCTTLGTAFKVNTSNDWTDQHNPTIAMSTSGYFVITWEDEVNGNFDIFAQRYDSLGSPVDSNFRVNDDMGTGSQQNPSIAMDCNDNFVIVWEDCRNGPFKPTVYAQKYNSDGNPLGSNYLIPNSQYSSFAQEYPTVSVSDNNIYCVWMDNRRAKGWDIYAKVVNWDWSDVEEEQQVNMPKSFELSQNYPNPFNPTTVIRYTISSHRLTHSTVAIYNILGQKVRTLVDEPKSVGNYEVIWDGRDDQRVEVASGIYFYQLKSGDNTETKKMLLLK